jgi:hypothetical protein
MSFSPYAHAADAAKVLLPTKAVTPARFVRGLPSAVPIRRDAATQSRRLGATRTQLGGTQAPFVDVAGAPSVKLVPLQNGGVATDVVRYSKHTDNLTDAELKPIRDVAERMLKDARLMSQGPLTYPMLRKRGHPYGRGLTSQGTRRGGLGRLQGRSVGVSNMAIVNKQSGELSRSWEASVGRGKGSVLTRIANTAPHAKHTAFGTPRMKAHGPYTTAVVRHLPELNREWRKLARLAWQREQMLERMGVLRGSNP